jgi:hypothetical protein
VGQPRRRPDRQGRLTAQAGRRRVVPGAARRAGAHQSLRIGRVRQVGPPSPLREISFPR